MPLHLRPVGPLPAAVYWRRRAGVLLVLVLLVLLTRCGGDEPEPEALSGPAPMAGPTVASVGPSAAPVPTASGVAAGCADTALAARTATDRGRYPTGARPVLTLSVRNTGAVPCTRPLGRGAVELTVFSGGDRIWSSDDCAPGGPPGPQQLAPQELETVTLTWAGRRSRPGCTGGSDAVEPGTYRVVGRVGTLRTAPAPFVVAD